MKGSPNAACPCGRPAKFKRCCAVYHGGRPAEPEALMRARYSAYASANVRYLMDTTHPDGPHYRSDRATWRSELAEYCKATRFLGLTVHEVEVDEASGTATVTFTASLQREGVDTGFTERSVFEKDGAKWKYHRGTEP